MAGLFVPLGEQREELAEIEAIPTRDKVYNISSTWSADKRW